METPLLALPNCATFVIGQGPITFRCRVFDLDFWFETFEPISKQPAARSGTGGVRIADRPPIWGCFCWQTCILDWRPFYFRICLGFGAVSFSFFYSLFLPALRQARAKYSKNNNTFKGWSWLNWTFREILKTHILDKKDESSTWKYGHY